MKKNNPAQIKTRLSQKADVPDTKKKLIRVSALSKADMQKRIIELETALQKQANEQIFQNEEKQKLADELLIANNEQGFQNKEKHKRADELVIANKELAFQNREKEKQFKREPLRMGRSAQQTRLCAYNTPRVLFRFNSFFFFH